MSMHYRPFKTEIVYRIFCNVGFCVFSYHLLARAKACSGDYRSALQSEKSAFNVYQKKVMYLLFSYFIIDEFFQLFPA